MVSECLKNNTPFGVLLLQAGPEVTEVEGLDVPGEPVPYKVGTLAKITEVVKLEDGRMLVTTVGTERFRLINYRRDKAYMTGDIEIWPEGNIVDSSAVLNGLVSQVHTAFEAYLKVLMELAGKQIEGLEIPADPMVLSYLVPNWLQIANDNKQKLLEIDAASERLREENLILQSETEFLRRIKEQAELEAETGQNDREKEAGLRKPGRYELGERFSKN